MRWPSPSPIWPSFPDHGNLCLKDSHVAIETHTVESGTVVKPHSRMTSKSVKDPGHSPCLHNTDDRPCAAVERGQIFKLMLFFCSSRCFFLSWGGAPWAQKHTVRSPHKEMAWRRIPDIWAKTYIDAQVAGSRNMVSAVIGRHRRLSIHAGLSRWVTLVRRPSSHCQDAAPYKRQRGTENGGKIMSSNID